MASPGVFSVATCLSLVETIDDKLINIEYDRVKHLDVNKKMNTLAKPSLTSKREFLKSLLIKSNLDELHSHISLEDTLLQKVVNTSKHITLTDSSTNTDEAATSRSSSSVPLHTPHHPSTQPYSAHEVRNFICKGINSMKDFVEVSPTLYITIISMLLIVISNCSLLNPGPNSISVYYQSIHGLLAFSSIGKDNPTLNLTKVIEFQSYLTVKCPDVVLLNETWFKSNILSSEIFPCNGYTIFRLDRSSSSHPPDSIDPKNTS